MRAADYDDEWELLARLLPEGWQEQARRSGAIQRSRGLSDPAALLRLLLMHVATGLSLRQTVARAKVQGLASMTDAGLLGRLRGAERWLVWMTGQMFTKSRFSRQARNETLARRQVRAVDATTVEEPGATGTDWRVHMSVALPEMRCDFYALSDVHGAETFKRVPVAAGDILLGDRGYCHREAVAYVLRRHGDVVVRLNLDCFPLRTRGGRRFDILAHLRRLRGFRSKAWPVAFTAAGKLHPARLCALRKTPQAAEAAKQKLLREAAKKQKKLKPTTLEAAEYVFVLTTLGREEFAVREVLELYRARWQIELLFKRLKSLLRLGHLPKKTDASSRAWIQAKLLVALLVEDLMAAAGLFSPWGHDEAAPQPR
jgi:IS4 transposase